MTSGWPGTNCPMRQPGESATARRTGRGSGGADDPAPGDQRRRRPDEPGGDRGGIAVLALIEGPAIESKLAIIVTRPGPAMPVKGDERADGARHELQHIAAPSRAIEGFVRDVKTGKPLAGVSSARPRP